MRSKKNQRPTGEDNRPKIKVRLDYKTVIIIRSMEAFKTWLSRFPDAKIITS